MISILVAAAMIAEPWTLNCPLLTDSTVRYDFSASVHQNGEDHKATMTFTLVGSKAASGTSRKLSATWDNLLVDGNETGDALTWSGDLGPAGTLDKLDNDESDDYRRMLMPVLFTYPTKPVDLNETWKMEWTKPGAKEPGATYEYKVVGTEKIGETETLKITSKMVEKATEPMQADGTWWVDKTSRVVKFQVNVKGWVVPMAGGSTMEGTLAGTIKK